MISLYFLLLSLILIDSMLVVHFGSHRVLLAEIRDIAEKKKSLGSVVKNVIKGSSANNLLWLDIGFFVGIVSLIDILFEILRYKDSSLIVVLLIFGVCGLFFSFGLIAVSKQEIPGYLHVQGVLAVVAGWIFIVVALLFLLVSFFLFV